MYSVVLLMALNGGADATALGFGKGCSKGCHVTCASSCASSCHVTCGGCMTPSAACSGCSVVMDCSCSSSCKGGHKFGGLFKKMREKMKGCHGCHSSCSTSCHGCHSSCATSCGGCAASMGGCAVIHGGCAAPVIIHPATEEPKKMEKEEPKKMEKTVDEAAPATLVVTLPADAKLIVDGTPTTSATERRTFTTPALNYGTDYSYTLRAEIIREGKTETRTEQVTVRAGEETKVNLSFTASVAAR